MPVKILSEMTKIPLNEVKPITKRQAPESDNSGSPVIKRQKKIDLNAQALRDKNPVSILNELRLGKVKYEIVEQQGPDHAPVFKVCVNIDGHNYFGQGGSKKLAKFRAAEDALKSFIQFPSYKTDTLFPSPLNGSGIDFTNDSYDDITKTATSGTKSSPPKLVKGPVMLINELYPHAKYECTTNEGSIQERFTIQLTINGHTFVGVGSSKKAAKAIAAKEALAKFNISTGTPDETKILGADQIKADNIAKLVRDKFDEILGTDPIHSKRKVLAGIVMTKGEEVADMEVICVATGTKCVSGEFMSMDGSSLNDMHAEIISRRCLINYLYNQLMLLENEDTAKESIFEERLHPVKEEIDGLATKYENSADCDGGFRLKSHIEFHLFINTAPCGDARIFSPHENDTNIDKHPNRISRGQLRTKIELGEGTIPVRSQATPVQTWDGIIQGDRLLTMSCSDKICRWNVVGVRGALLSHFVEPIYFSSLVLGSLLKPTHLFRAICGRVEHIVQGLPPPYRLNRPTMLPTTQIELRQPLKAPTFSILWYKGLDAPEIIQTQTGRLDKVMGSITPQVDENDEGIEQKNATISGCSTVCKKYLVRRFFQLCQMALLCDDRVRSISGIERNLPQLYSDAKESAISYMTAKNCLNDAFKKAELGEWIAKPLEQDTFSIFNEDF